MAIAATSNERRTIRNSRHFVFWTVVFTASFLGGKWLFVRGGWEPQGLPGIAFSLLPLIPGLLAMRAYLRFFRETDEMMREIQTEGVLFAFAATVVFWGAIQLPEHVWLPKVKADIVMAFMLLSFAFGVCRASLRRYK